MTEQKVIQTAKALGFNLDYTQWKVKGKNWMRFIHPLAPKEDNHEFIVIIYKDYTLDTILNIFADVLLKLGQYQKIKQFQEFI